LYIKFYAEDRFENELNSFTATEELETWGNETFTFKIPGTLATTGRSLKYDDSEQFRLSVAEPPPFIPDKSNLNIKDPNTGITYAVIKTRPLGDYTYIAEDVDNRVWREFTFPESTISWSKRETDGSITYEQRKLSNLTIKQLLTWEMVANCRPRVEGTYDEIATRIHFEPILVDGLQGYQINLPLFDYPCTDMLLPLWSVQNANTRILYEGSNVQHAPNQPNRYQISGEVQKTMHLLNKGGDGNE